MMGGFVLGQVSALSPDYEKAKIAAARLFKIFDRKSKIDSSSEDGLTPVRIFSICVNYTDFCEATAEDNETPPVQLHPYYTGTVFWTSAKLGHLMFPYHVSNTTVLGHRWAH